MIFDQVIGENCIQNDFFMLTQETRIYRLVMRNRDFDVFQKHVFQKNVFLLEMGISVRLNLKGLEFTNKMPSKRTVSLITFLIDKAFIRTKLVIQMQSLPTSFHAKLKLQKL